MKSPSRLVITQPNFNVYSETFIRNHIRCLGDFATIHDLAGGWIPSHADGKPLVSKPWRFFEKVAAKLQGKPFIYGMTARAVKSWLQRENIQFVLCEYGPGGVAMMPICKALNIPFGVHFFGLDLHGKKLIAEYGSQYIAMFREASLIIAISTLQRRVLIDMGCPPEKIRHIVCGADLVYAASHIPETKPPVFIAVGRMIEKKAPLHTLAAFAIVNKTHPETRLQYIGDGPLKSDCVDFVRENQLTDKVEFLSARKPDFIATALQQALCFVQHSVTAADGDAEGTPVAILDAGLAGIPVVATRHAGIADTVVDGVTGILVAEHDVQGMAAAMLKILENPEMAYQMGVAAHEHVKTHFAVDVTIKQLWEAIKWAYSTSVSSLPSHL